LVPLVEPTDVDGGRRTGTSDATDAGAERSDDEVVADASERDGNSEPRQPGAMPDPDSRPVIAECLERRDGDAFCRDDQRFVCEQNRRQATALACPRGARCTESEGRSVTCECGLGFELNDDTGVCTDTDDCKGQSCGAGGTCKDGRNEYTCECVAGYMNDGPRTCVAMNAPCHACTASFMCVESPDHYLCLGQYLQSPMPDVDAVAKTPPRYRVAKGTVVDDVTGLTWQRERPAVYSGCTGRDPQSSMKGTAGMSCRWVEAKTYCAALELDGSRGFRVPSKIELESILKLDQTWPRMDTSVFPPGDYSKFWTSSPGIVNPAFAWTIDFTYGYSQARPATEIGFVRCVK
jgi:hypothetical protein